MMPPTRIEQLNNFQDAVQSPDGLDRLRALQAVEQALPSSQGLMGMPQVQAPMPMVPRQYGGEVGTGGLVEVLDDGTQVFDNTEQGILNRSLHGGMLQGQTQTATAPSSFSGGTDAPGTLAGGAQEVQSMSDVTPLAPVATGMPASLMEMPSVQARGGVYNASEFRDAGVDLATPAGIPETIIQQGQEQVGSMYRDPHTGKIPYALYQPQPVNTYGQGYDLGGMDYFTANQLALNEGADRFMYGGKYAAVDPGLLSNYRDNMDAGFSEETAYGMIKPWGANVERDKIREATIGPMHAPGRPGVPYTPSSADREEARLIAEGYERDRSGRLTRFSGTSRAEKYRQLVEQGVNMDNPYTRQLHGFKHGGSLADTAEGLASFGRYGDNILVHMNPEELSGLASLGQITYNPVTGLPEAFSLKGIFKAVRKIAPIALAIAAPYAFGATTALGIGASTALGSFAGNLIAGAKPGDALKAGLMSGLFAGGGAYLGGAASGFGSAGSQAAGQGAAGYGSAAMGSSAGVNQAGQAMYGSTAGSSALKAGLKAPVSMGAKGLGQGLAGGGGSQFSGVASYGNIPRAAINTAARPPLQLAPKPVVEGTTVFGMPKNPNMAQIGQQQAGQTVQNFTPTPVENIATINPNIVQPNQFNQTLTGADLATYSKQQGLNQLPYESPTADLRIQSRAQLEGTPTRPSIFQDSSMDNFKRIGQNIYDDYSTKEGIAKLVAMDLSTPDYDVMYANEAREKEQQLREAGYTVDTGFDGQTVIRDSSGVTLPRNLTASMILDRALGRAPRTNLVARTDYATAKEGGLISLKHGGEFSGMVPGEGHGMEDNVFMPITEGKKQVGTLAVSPSEYVVDSYTMAALGNGNADAGAKVMDRVVKHVRKKAYGDTEQPNEISGLQALKPMMERV